MIALYRYQLSGLLLSQRYLPPVLVFLAALSVGTSSDTSPLLHAYSFCVAAIFACALWLAVAVVNHENPVQRQVIVVSAGSSRRVLTVTVAVALTGCLFLTAIGLVYPMLVGQRTVTAGTVAAGAVAQMSAACVGTAVGLVTSRLVITRLGVAVVVAVAALLAMLLVGWISPISPLIRLLADAGSPGGIAVRLGALAVVSAAMLAAGTVLTRLVSDRRE